MDAYDEGPDARREQPGGSEDPVSSVPEGATSDVPEDPAPGGVAGPRGPGGPGPDAAAASGPPPAPATSSEPAESGGATEPPAVPGIPLAPEPAPEPGAGVSTEPVPGPDSGISTEPVPGPDSGISTEPVPGPDSGISAEPAPGPDAALAPRTGIAALSLRYQIAAALALAVLAVAACVHLGMVFLHVAPANTLTKKHGKAIDDWIYPEFEQNWKLFAPNPLQQNIDVQVRAELRTGNGGERTTGWYDLSALDGAAIHGNLLPSHTQQNELRRAWDFYLASHDGENRPTGLRGALSENYLRRVVVLRLAREHAAGRGETLERVQVRSRTANVPSPKWSDEKVSTTPAYHQLPWWSLPDGERTEASA
ncbi:DUF5819 family protein [Streptomyces sp. NPDC001795]|uniref:DUF5819 family protein n=1 Tax=Streptomyces sp. NPDC001795 TaxID=3154525 RepID=UPI003322BF53